MLQKVLQQFGFLGSLCIRVSVAWEPGQVGLRMIFFQMDMPRNDGTKLPALGAWQYDIGHAPQQCGYSGLWYLSLGHVFADHRPQLRPRRRDGYRCRHYAFYQFGQYRLRIPRRRSRYHAAHGSPVPAA